MASFVLFFTSCKKEEMKITKRLDWEGTAEGPDPWNEKIFIFSESEVTEVICFRKGTVYLVKLKRWETEFSDIEIDEELSFEKVGEINVLIKTLVSGFSHADQVVGYEADLPIGKLVGDKDRKFFLNGKTLSEYHKKNTAIMTDHLTHDYLGYKYGSKQNVSLQSQPGSLKIGDMDLGYKSPLLGHKQDGDLFIQIDPNLNEYSPYCKNQLKYLIFTKKTESPTKKQKLETVYSFPR